MAITVNYYPRMDNIAQTAYGGGQTQEGIRQQNFGLNVEQLAQRERMQNQDIAYRQGAQVFDAQVGLEQQQRNIAANQWAQAQQQAGRERLAAFDAQQRQQAMAYQAAQNQQNMQSQIAERRNLQLFDAAQQAQARQENFANQLTLQDYVQQGRLDLVKAQLDAEGQSKVAEFQRREEAIRRWAEDSSAKPEVVRDAMTQLYSQISGANLERYVARGMTLDEWANENIKFFDNGMMLTRQPDGNAKVDFPPKENPDMVFSIPDETGQFTQYKVGMPFQYNGRDWVGLPNGQWQDITPQQQQQEGYRQAPQRSEVLKLAKELWDDWQNSSAAKSGQQLRPKDFISEAEDFFGVNPMERSQYLPNPAGELGAANGYARDDGHFYAQDILQHVPQSGMDAQSFLSGFEPYLPRVTVESVGTIETIPPGALYLLISKDGSQKIVTRGQEGWQQ